MIFSNKFVSETLEYSTYEKNSSSPLFRKSFTLEKTVKNAKILIAGLGFYELFINGKKITKGHIAPYINNTDHIVYYDKYDIKPYLIIGENVIGVMLGDGYQVGKLPLWNLADRASNSAPMLSLCVEIMHGDSMLCFEADEFLCKKGPVLFNDLRSGVHYDARLEEDGWTKPGFKERGWHKPIYVTKPKGICKICEAEPVVITKEMKPVRIFKGELAEYKCSKVVAEQLKDINLFENAPDRKNGYIYDFGENNSGIYRLKIKGERGRKISIQCAEQIDDCGKLTYSNICFFPDGFSQRDIYYLKGDDTEIFEPMFTFHGFRYIYISGINENQATEDLLTYLVMSSDLEERGHFECSNSRINDIYNMGRRSDISNFFYFPMDCPHREKNGWTGDAAASAEHMIMTIGAEKSWQEWLCNIRAAQKEDGCIPCIVPTDTWGYDWGNGPLWDCVLFELPYMIYKYRGETDVIKENADAMLKYLKFIAGKRRNDGIVEMGLGDWATVADLEETDINFANVGLVESIMVFDICSKASEMFDVINLPDYKSVSEKLKDEIKAAILAVYKENDSPAFKDKSQSSQAMGIYYNIFDEGEREQAAKALVSLIQNSNDCFTCGFAGLRVLFHCLAQYGYEEYAYKLITRPEFPSYGYWLDKGMTTMPERFGKFDKYYNASANHHFMGDVVNWFMRWIGGLNVVNSSLVKISPRFINDVDWCRTWHNLPNGKIEIEWERKESEIKLCVKCSKGIQYELDTAMNYQCIEIGNGTYLLNDMV